MPSFITENWTFLQQNLWPGMPMFAMFLLSLGILAADTRGSTRRIFWYSVLLLAGVVYNPYFWFSIVNRVYQGDDLVQLRLAWLVPAFLIMAYAMSRLAFMVKKWQVSAGIAALFVLFIWWAGVEFHPGLLVEKENIYKISQDAKESADLILADRKADPGVMSDRPKLREINTTDCGNDITPANYYHFGIRQYTSAFTVHPVLVTEEMYQAEDFDVIRYYQEPCQYLSYEISAEPVGESAALYGYQEIARTEGHVIMRYHRDAAVYLVIRGQTMADTSGRLEGVSGTASLTTSGWWSVLELGRMLSDVRFDAAYASETGQPARTADVILRMNQNEDSVSEVFSLSSLNDISWGVCEGMTKAEAAAQYGEAALYNGSRKDDLYVSPVGAESRYAAVQRYSQGMGDCVKSLRSDGMNILVAANPSIVWWLKECTRGEKELKSLSQGDCVKLRFTDGEWFVEEVMTDPS